MSTLDLSTLSVGPSRNGTGKQLDPGAKVIRYGGDYETRIRRSGNRSNQNLVLAWEALPFAECDTVESWLEDTYGTISFNITGCEWVDDQVKYVYLGLDRSNSGPETDSLTVRLRKVFN